MREREIYEKNCIILYVNTSILCFFSCSKKDGYISKISSEKDISNQETEFTIQESNTLKRIDENNSVDILKLCEENKNNIDLKNFDFLDEIIGKTFVYNKCHFYPLKYKSGNDYITKGAIVLISTKENCSIVAFIESNGNNDIEQWIYKSFSVIQHDEDTIIWDKLLEKVSNENETILGLYLYKKGTHLKAEGVYRPNYIVQIDNYNGSFILTDNFSEIFEMVNDL